MREAEETPDGVLTLLQSVLAQQEAAPPPMPMAPPMPQGMPPEMMGMPPQGMPPMPPQGMAPPPMGIESISVDETVMPGMYRGGPVQNFNQGSGAMGVTPANDAFAAYPSDVVEEAQRRVRHMVDGGMVQNYNQGGVVQHFQDGSTPPLGVELPGTRGFAPAQREDAGDYISSILGQQSAVVPDLQTAMTNEAAILESLGLGTSKEDRQAEALFKLGQAGFRFAGNVGANGPMQGSTAARLSQVLDPLSSDIGDIAAERNKEQTSLKMLGYQGAKAEIDAAKASNAALAKSKVDVALKVGEMPRLSAKEIELNFLREAGLTDAQIIERQYPGKTLTGSAGDIEALKAMGYDNERIVELLFSSKSSTFSEQKAFLEGLGLPSDELADRLGLGLPEEKQPTAIQVKVTMMEDAGFSPKEILDRIAPPDTPSAFREQLDLLVADGWTQTSALNLLIGDKSTARDQRIEDIMKASGKTRDEVVLALEKEIRVDPQTGVFNVYDSLTGELTPLIADWSSVSGANAPRVTVPPLSTENIIPLIREGEGVGIKASLANTINSTIGQFMPEGWEFDSEREASERIGAINVAINEAFTGGGRSPVITLKKLQELFPTPREAWLNPRDASTKFVTSAGYLAQVYADDLRGSNDPNLGRKGMQDLAVRAEGMLNALQLIVTPETLTEIVAAANNGVSASDQFNTMTAAEITAITPEQRLAMTPLQLAAFYDRSEALLGEN